VAAARDRSASRSWLWPSIPWSGYSSFMCATLRVERYRPMLT